MQRNANNASHWSAESTLEPVSKLRGRKYFRSVANWSNLFSLLINKYLSGEYYKQWSPRDTTIGRNSSLNAFCVCALSHAVMSDCLWPHGLWATRLFCSWNFPGKNPGVGCHFLLQGIFPTQGSNPRFLPLLLWQLLFSHPVVTALLWVHRLKFVRQEYWSGLPFLFSRGSSWPRDQTRVSCIAGGFFTTEPQGKTLSLVAYV